MPTPKRILQSIVPPVLWSIGSGFKRRIVRSTTFFQYAPKGWDTPLPGTNQDYWNTFIDRERSLCEALIASERTGEPLVVVEEDALKHVTFGYVLAMAAREQPRITILDYGGNLGDYYWLGKMLMPEIELDYHCKELPTIAGAGREISPAITWHIDDDCLAQPYDLVMFSSSLQYLTEWRAILQRAAAATRRYLFLSDTPCVRNVPTFVATERSGGVTNLHWQLNRADVVSTVHGTGLRLVREFAMGPYPPVANAPEQPTRAGWLFERA